MPWRQTSPIDQKMSCIADDLRHTLPIIEWCELSGVSRKTGYTWIERSRKHGPLGLEERSRQPHSSPITRPAMWWIPALRGAGITRRGAPRHGFPCSRNVLHVGRDRCAPPSMIS